MANLLRVLVGVVLGAAVITAIRHFVPEPWTLVAWVAFVIVVAIGCNVATGRPWWAIWSPRFDRKPR